MTVRCGVSPATAQASVPSSVEAVLVDRRLHELPDVGELEPAARVVQRLAHGVEPREQRRIDSTVSQPSSLQ